MMFFCCFSLFHLRPLANKIFVYYSALSAAWTNNFSGIRFIVKHSNSRLLYAFKFIRINLRQYIRIEELLQQKNNRSTELLNRHYSCRVHLNKSFIRRLGIKTMQQRNRNSPSCANVRRETRRI